MPNPILIADPSREPATLRDLDYLERRVVALETMLAERFGFLQEQVALPRPATPSWLVEG